MYGKLSGNTITPAPYYVERNGDNIFGYNLEGNSEMLLQDGYKPIVDSDTPPESFIKPRKVWTETENSIVASWVDDYVAPTQEEVTAANENSRQLAYQSTTDVMTLRKLRKQALGTWEQADEDNYVSEIKRMTQEINDKYPDLKE